MAMRSFTLPYIVGRLPLHRYFCVSSPNKLWERTALSFKENRSMSTVRSSSAASRSEINTAIFKHCVVDGHISHIQKICDPVPKDFKAAVMSSESVFHHPETRDSEALFRKALFKHIQQMLVRAQVRMRSFFF